ncbi:MAG TPA: hypothetical protein VMW27_20275, partial [Thermoanaerobaculia bacterium]|nr:hypothetical protein [Thermoanaerobaculia bacterium]
AALSVMIVLALASPLAAAEPAGPWLSRLQEATGQVLEEWRGWWLPETPADAVRSEDVGSAKEGCGMDPNGSAGPTTIASCKKKEGRTSNPGSGRELILRR